MDEEEINDDEKEGAKFIKTTDVMTYTIDRQKTQSHGRGAGGGGRGGRGLVGRGRGGGEGGPGGKGRGGANVGNKGLHGVAVEQKKSPNPAMVDVTVVGVRILCSFSVCRSRRPSFLLSVVGRGGYPPTCPLFSSYSPLLYFKLLYF